MNLINAHRLYILLSSIRTQANASPEKFTIAAKVAIAENMRNLVKPARSYEEQRDALIKEYGEIIVEPVPVAEEGKPQPLPKPDRWRVNPESDKFPAFETLVTELGDKPANVKLRFIYESQLEGAPLTVDQLDRLSKLGLLKPVL